MGMVLLHVLADKRDKQDAVLYVFFAYGCPLSKNCSDFCWLALLKLDGNLLNIVVTLILSPTADLCLLSEWVSVCVMNKRGKRNKGVK